MQSKKYSPHCGKINRQKISKFSQIKSRGTSRSKPFFAICPYKNLKGLVESVIRSVPKFKAMSGFQNNGSILKLILFGIISSDVNDKSKIVYLAFYGIKKHIAKIFGIGDINDANLALSANLCTIVTGWKHVTTGRKGTCRGDLGASSICDIDGRASIIGIYAAGSLEQCELGGRPAIHLNLKDVLS